MAEIKIKKKSPIWPWILLVIIILAALAYYFMVYKNGYIDENGINIGQDEQIKNSTGENMRIPSKDYYYTLLENVA